jgi:antitoxin MazE6
MIADCCPPPLWPFPSCAPGLDADLLRGHTLGMRIAVSIPDDVFENAERLARRAGRSRSEVFSAALREYIARHAPDEVTDAMNRVCEQVSDPSDAFVAAAGRRVLEHVEW